MAFTISYFGKYINLLAAISYVHAFMWGALFYTHTMAVLLDFAGATAVVLDGDIIYKKIKKKHT